MTARHDRARITELGFARWLNDNGWPYAEAVGKNAKGADITGLAGLSVEIKARSDFQPKGWVAQASSRPGLPLVVMRLNGQGLASIEDWFVGTTVGTMFPVLRQAGYGERL